MATMSPPMDKRAAASAAALVGLLALVAASARTRLFHEGEPPISSATARLLVDFGAYLFITALLVAAALMVWALWPRERDPGPEVKRRGPLEAVMQSVALIAALLFLVGAAMARRQIALKGPGRGGAVGAVAPPISPLTSSASPVPPGFDGLAAALVFITLAVAGLVIGRRWLRRRTAAAERRALERRLSEVVEDTLDDLRTDGDTRRAVVRAYARMESVLALHGLGRRAPEAPLEFMQRALRRLEISAGSIQRLTALFEEARFSTHPISPAMRAEAIDALAAIRSELFAPAQPPGGTLHVAG